jgi:hypothetical protein
MCNVGPVFREGARAGRPREHACQVEYAHAVQGAVRLTERLGRRIPDLRHFHHGLRRQQRTLRMRQPLVVRPAYRVAQPLRRERVLELPCPPPHARRRDLLLRGVLPQPQLRQDPRRMGEAPVQVDEASVAALPDGGHLHARAPRDRVHAWRPQVDVAAQRRCRVPHAHRQRLFPPAAHLPDAVRFLPDERERRSRPLAEMEGRLEDRVFPSIVMSVSGASSSPAMSAARSTAERSILKSPPIAEIRPDSARPVSACR